MPGILVLPAPANLPNQKRVGLLLTSQLAQ